MVLFSLRAQEKVLYVIYLSINFFLQISDIRTHGGTLVKEGTVGLKSARGQVTGKMTIPLIFSTILRFGDTKMKQIL